MEQRKPFRFDERFPHLREYSTINSTDAKAPVILGSKISFKVERTWLSYVSEDDRWSPLQQKEEVSLDCTKREEAVDGKVVPLQALPCHDYRDSGRRVIVPNTNLFIEKTFSVDDQSGRRESVCWSGTKLAVIVSPKFEYSSGALTHVNERYQLKIQIKSTATSLGDDFVAEMNMWYGAKELASRWNGFPCFGQTIFAKTPLSFYQLPLSHLLPTISISRLMLQSHKCSTN